MARETYEQLVARLHMEAIAKGRKAYRDPVTRTRVCTSAFLASRGACCECDCRHCPFPRAVATAGGDGGGDGDGSGAGSAARNVAGGCGDAAGT